MGTDTAATERLPWLADEPSRKPLARRGRRTFLPIVAAAIALVATAGFWIGLGGAERRATPNPAHARPSLTVRLPPPRTTRVPEVRIAPVKEVRPSAAPEVRPVPPREVRIILPPHRRTAAIDQSRTRRHDEPVTATREPSKASPRTSTVGRSASRRTNNVYILPRPWNPRTERGASGRLVEVGAFGSVRQAKRGWRFMVRTYPAMAHLPAVVRPTRNSRGQMFFRFQVGTTSQAHSEILCQRMVTIRLSCAVVGLSWKRKVER